MESKHSNLNIVELSDREPLLPGLTDLWEASVRATHTFLSEAEILRIRGVVPQAILGVPHLLLAQEGGEVLGFAGTAGDRLEMLFLRPEARGRGVGRALIEHAIRCLGVAEVTVNEQNPAAVGFYRHLGFVPFRRTDTDEEGAPYPLLYLRLEGGAAGAVEH